MDEIKRDEPGQEAATPSTEGEPDVEGSSMLLHPGLARDMMRAQDMDLGRDLLARQQAKEAKEARQGQRDAAAATADAEAQPEPGYRPTRAAAPAH
jgi:hypothetical protein